MFPRRSEYSEISESLALNLIIFLPITNKILIPPFQCILKQTFAFSLVKLIGCSFSAVSACSILCVGPLPRINLCFLVINVGG